MLLLAPLLAVVSSALAPAPAEAASPPPITVKVGYADSRGTNFPTPWYGDSSVTAFDGCQPPSSCNYDGGAIEVINTTGSTVEVNSLSVKLDTCTYAIWGSPNVFLPAGGIMIFAQTASGVGNGCENGDGTFDTSDLGPGGASWSGNCTRDAMKPEVDVTVNNTLETFSDSLQILNTGGWDGNACSGIASESHPWQVLLPPGSNTPRGGPSPTANSTTCTGADPVDCHTGEFWQRFGDLAIPGRGVPLDFFRTYSTLAAAEDGPLGYGWTNSYNMALSIDSVTGIATVHQETGANISAAPCQVGAPNCPAAGYQFPSFIFATLVHNPDGTYTFSHTNGDQFVFSASGQLTAELERSGYATTLSYTGGKLASVTDPAGRVLSLSYGANGRLASVSDPAGHQVAYGYDGSGNLTSVKDVGGGMTYFSYDSSHRMLRVTDPNGGTLTNVYDASGRVVSQTDPMHRTTTWSYGAGTTTVVDPAGHASLQTYANDELVAVTNGYGTPEAATTTVTYDPSTRAVATITYPNNHTSRFTWDALNNLLTATDALNRTTRYSYNGFGETLTVTDPMGVTTANAYDAHGNLLSTATPLTPSSPAVSKTVSYAYGDAAHPGDVTAVTDPNGGVWALGHDANGDLVSITDPLGERTQDCYDSIGRLTAQISPKGSAAGVGCSTANPTFTTLISRNAFGDPVTVTDGVGNTTTYGYDSNRNLVRSKDGLNQTTTYFYDADNEVTQTVRPDGSSLGSAYDADGNLIGQVNGLGVTTTYGYDPLNRVASTIDGLGRTTSFGYDPAGNRITKQDPGGNCAATPKIGCTTLTYDAGNQLVRIDYSDGKTPSATFAYDADGRQTDMGSLDATCPTCSHTETTSAYDSLGRLIQNQETGAGSNLVAGTATLNYGYDLAGHLTSMAIPTALNVTATVGQSVIALGQGNLSRTYDAAGRMHSVTSWAGNTTTFGYDANSDLTSIAYPNGTLATYNYDAADRTASIVDAGAGGVPFLSIPYTRDADGRIASDNPAPSPVAASTQSYGYDPAGRLASASLTPAPTSLTKSWSYDAADRLTQISHLGQVTTTLSYDAADELTSAGDTTFSYDTRGNRLGSVDALGTTTTYGYDQANRLTSYTGPVVGAAIQASGSSMVSGTTQASYAYQADGLRNDMAWDRAEGMPLIVSSPVAVSGGIQEYVTGPGGRVVEIDLLPIASTSASLQGVGFSTTQTVYMHSDAMGSTRVLTSATGQPLVGYSYDPYGQATLTTLSSATTSIVNPILFQGQYLDPLSGLMYLRNRWYDPATTQFLTRDPLVALTRSAYSYAGGDPVNGSDPSGLCIGPSVCPHWLQTSSQFLGFGSIVRGIWHKFTSPSHTYGEANKLGSYSTGTQQGVEMAGSSALEAGGLFTAARFLSWGGWIVSGTASLIDVLCSVDRQVP